MNVNFFNEDVDKNKNNNEKDDIARSYTPFFL